MKQLPSSASELAQIRDCSQQAVWIWPPCSGAQEFNSMEMGCSTASCKAAQAHQLSSTDPPLAQQRCSQTGLRKLCKRSYLYSQAKSLFHTLLAFVLSSVLCSFCIGITSSKPHHWEGSKGSEWQSTTFGMLSSRINTKVCLHANKKCFSSLTAKFQLFSLNQAL